MSTNRNLVVLTAVAAAGLAGACSDSGDSGTEGLSSGDGYSVRGALAELPAAVAGDAVEIHTADVATAIELTGLERAASTEADSLLAWLGPLTGVPVQGKQAAPVFIPFAEVLQIERAGTQMAEYEEELGWTVADVDAFVEQATPPDTFTVVSGDFDNDTLSSDLSEVEDSIVTNLEGEDRKLSDTRTAASPLGIPIRLSADEGRIAASPSTPFVRDWVDGEGETLADDDALAAVAAALDGEGVISAVLSSAGSGGVEAALPDQLDPERMEQLLEELDVQLVPVAFDAVGIGWSVVDDEATVSVVYHFADEDRASQAVDPLETLYADGTSLATQEPFSERFSVEDVEQNGDVVTVTVTPSDDGRPSDLFQMWQRRELLFASR